MPQQAKTGNRWGTRDSGDKIQEDRTAEKPKKIIGKDEVPSSNLGSSSSETRCPARDSGFFHLSGGETAQQETHTDRF